MPWNQVLRLLPAITKYQEAFLLMIQNARDTQSSLSGKTRGNLKIVLLCRHCAEARVWWASSDGEQCRGGSLKISIVTGIELGPQPYLAA